MRKFANGTEAYQDGDLEKLSHLFAAAYEIWRKSMYGPGKPGDFGSCVLGAGLSVAYAPPRARYPRRKLVVGSPGQSDGSYCVDAAQKFLEDHGIRTEFEWGRLD